LGVTKGTAPGLDLEDVSSIREFFARFGQVDHVVVAAGDARFGTLDQLDEAAFAVGLRSKLIGQVHIALAALPRLSRGGSVTLTSGALSHSPIVGSAAVALVNGAVDSFVKAAALEAPAGRRINVVSPGWIRETRIRMGLDPEPGVSAIDVAKLYVEAIESSLHGQVLSAG
jgi:NAD(P)-dependent dehydrogenase (short-subunit alcohol dehydrogenase family)